MHDPHLECCRVALRILEVPFAALTAPEPPSGDVRANMVVASLGRPLFISWSPDGRHLVQVIGLACPKQKDAD